MKTISTSPLAAGAAVKDITPPLNVGLLMSSVEGRWAPFRSVRTPLKARALVLQFDNVRVALVSVDLLGFKDRVVGGWSQFKRAIASEIPGGMNPSHIVISCTHSHTAPESSGSTDLYLTPQFRAWLRHVRKQIAKAITEAAGRAQPCAVTHACAELQGFSLQRRIPTKSGVQMSDSMQPIPPKLFKRGPVDRRVRSLFFHGLDGTKIATLVHAICHPVHEMCLPHVSADFPGELCAALEASPGIGVPLFFNGSAGDINPPTVSCGAKASRNHGQALAKVVKGAARQAQELPTSPVVFRSRNVALPTRSLKSGSRGRSCVARLNALRLGSLAIVLLPGELFTQVAWDMEKASPFKQTLLIGFCENSIGYVPSRQAFQEGGYELGPSKWSFLQPIAESILRDEVARLLRELEEVHTNARKPPQAVKATRKWHLPSDANARPVVHLV